MRSKHSHRPSSLLEALEQRRLMSVSYSLIDLGNLGGGSAVAYDMNEAGQIVGYSVNAASQSRAFIWQNGAMSDIGSMGTQARAINDVGQVVGGSSLWQNGVVTNLGISALGVNDAGVVVGTRNGRAVRWQNGVVSELGSLGGPGGVAYDVNDGGQISGTSYTTGTTVLGPATHAFRWQAGAMGDQGVLSGDEESAAYAINSLGQTAGISFHTLGNPDLYEVIARAFFHNGSTMIDLGAPPNSSALDLNDSGQVVGTMRAPGGNFRDHAFIWQSGVLTDLNSLVPGGSGLTLVEARAINNAGQIAGWGYDAASNYHAFLLNPQTTNAPAIAIGDTSAIEGNSGTRPMTFTVRLSASSPQTVSVNYATANGTATAASDYIAVSGTLTFAPGQTSRTITVQIRGDRTRENNETFFVNLSAPTNASLADDRAVGTIIDDDRNGAAPPTEGSMPVSIDGNTLLRTVRLVPHFATSERLLVDGDEIELLL